MSKSKQFAAFVLATMTATSLLCESRCPGNVESLAYQSLNRHQIVIRVSINHSGPYNFLLDTGTQMTIIDPALAGELHLATSGEASVATAGVHASASMAQVDLVEAGSHRLAGLKVLVFDIEVVQGKTRDVRGVLGEDFLENFDVLIDNAHRLVCLDDTGRMRAEVKGQHVALLNPEWEQGNDLARPLVVTVRLSDRMEPVKLELDSGAEVCFLYSASAHMALGAFRETSLQGSGADGKVRTFATLPPQNIRIGSVEISRVPFITLLGVRKDVHTSVYDGLLPVGLFKTVFISHSEGFAVLEP
jgi:Aspartyl protease